MTPQSTTPNKDLREKIEDILKKAFFMGLETGKINVHYKTSNERFQPQDLTQSLLALLDEETRKARVEELRKICVLCGEEDMPDFIHQYQTDRIQKLQRATKGGK